MGPIAAGDDGRPRAFSVEEKAAALTKDEARQLRLRRILRAYAMLDTKVRYTQGINFVASMLLDACEQSATSGRAQSGLLGEPEEAAFFLLVAFAQRRGCSGLWQSVLRRLSLG